MDEDNSVVSDLTGMIERMSRRAITAEVERDRLRGRVNELMAQNTTLEDELGQALDDRDEARRERDARFTSEQVGNAQTSEALLVTTPLKHRIEELERKLRAYDEDRHAERERADRMTRVANQFELEAAEARKLAQETNDALKAIASQRDHWYEAHRQLKIDQAGWSGTETGLRGRIRHLEGVSNQVQNQRDEALAKLRKITDERDELRLTEAQAIARELKLKRIRELVRSDRTEAAYRFVTYRIGMGEHPRHLGATIGEIRTVLDEKVPPVPSDAD